MIEQSLKIFRTAAAVGNFTEAAALSGMTQPNVTKQIANLERELDVKLTPAGEMLKDECERLFSLEADVLRKVRSARQGMRPYLIGGTATAGSFLLIGMTAIYQKKHPDCRLHLKIERPDALHRMLASGEVHHMFEAVFKGLARALAAAVSIDPCGNGVPSTKGVL